MTASIYAFEVGQGDCHMIVADREAIIIDAGPPSSPITEFLLRYGYRVKLLVLTHNDKDHSGGAARLLTELGHLGRIDSFGSLQDRRKNSEAYRAHAIALELWKKKLLPHIWRAEIDQGPKQVAILAKDYALSLLHPAYVDNLEALGQYDRPAAGRHRTCAVLRLCDSS